MMMAPIISIVAPLPRKSSSAPRNGVRIMAEMLKIDRSTYARYESGASTGYPVNVIKKCAEIFGVSTDKLLDGYNRFIFEGQVEQVKRKRLESGLGQDAFGRLYGVSGNTVRRWENGEVRMSRRFWEKIFDVYK